MKGTNKIIFSGILSIMMLMLFVAIAAVPTVAYADNCTYHSHEGCFGNYLYWYDSCGNQQDIAQYCVNGCYNGACAYNYYYGNMCTSHAYQRCDGNYVYWYDSCGNQQDSLQYCANGCYNGICQNYNNNYNNNNNNYNYNYNSNSSCTYHAYKLCSGNNVYWYDSCGNQQDLDSSCVNGQTCQYGQCATVTQNYTQPYIAHYRTACYGNSVEWFDSLGTASGLYKNCKDSNSCTVDSCSKSKCSNILKCDGSTCATNSADYNKYCVTTPPEVVTPPATVTPPTQTTPSTQTPSQTPATTQSTDQKSGLSISFFTKATQANNQWQKTADIGPNGQVYFMVSVTNISTKQIDNVNISANIPAEVTSLGNLQINGVQFSGDIITGINIGSISPQNTKLITFEGKTQAITQGSTKQAVTTSTISGVTLTDSVSLNLKTTSDQPQTQAAAAVSSQAETGGFMGFLKKWYLWIIAGLVLIILFIVVYRRLSSNI